MSKAYQVIYADPPWRYENGTPGREIERHYQTMPLPEIKALELPPMATDAVLYLWATAPLLIEALEVLSAWGFTYRTSAVWDKQKLGMGYWFRGQHELLLLGIRSKPKAPAPAARIPSVVRLPRTAHSRKPDAIREHIENAWPGALRLELFAREQWPGWDVLGNEVRETLFVHADRIAVPS